MTSTRSLVLVAVVITVVAAAQARLFPYLPGDVAAERAIQSLSPGTSWVRPVLATASAPLKYLLMAIGVLGAWRLAGLRAALVVVAAIVLEQTLGEASKLLFARPRPSGQLVAVMGAPSGFSFPSTFMTIYAVTIGALGVLAWRQRPGALRTSVLLVSALVLVIAAGARIVPGAHWPSDALGTYAICLSWLAVAFSAAGVPSR
ncbi:MAG TPA: phosphatase PAP2 family protein [Vicinamibacterales bacterium]|nr:phosphatase PAP2 family protein [Vicinamibacterales bacterium]